MRQYLNFSLIITLLTILGIIFSQNIPLKIFDTPMMDFAIFAVGIIASLIVCLISSNFAIKHDTKSACFWDCITDVISIFLHIAGAVLWFYHGKDLFPKNFISELEFYLVFWCIVSMTIISVVEFVLMLNNCLESMLLKVNN